MVHGINSDDAFELEVIWSLSDKNLKWPAEQFAPIISENKLLEIVSVDGGDRALFVNTYQNCTHLDQSQRNLKA
jgi:hypothetical protein